MSTTVRFKMQAELQKVLLKGNFNRLGEEPAVVAHHRTPHKRSTRVTPKKPSIPQESPLKKLRPEVTADVSTLKEEQLPQMDPFFTLQQTNHVRKTVTGIVYRYQRGYTCAVRQPATIRDLL